MARTIPWARNDDDSFRTTRDPFHPDVPDDTIARTFGAMGRAHHDTIQVLTEHPERMRRLLGAPDFIEAVRHELVKESQEAYFAYFNGWWPLRNVWLGVNATNQAEADARIAPLIDTPATIRFLACEPLTEPIDLYAAVFGPEYPWEGEAPRIPGMNALNFIDGYGYGLDWVTTGGESAPDARPTHPDWVRSLREQCSEAGLPFTFTGWGDWFPRDQWEHNPDLILPDDCDAYRDAPDVHLFRDGHEHHPMHRVGAANAGRALDGRTWSEKPQSTEVPA